MGRSLRILLLIVLILVPLLFYHPFGKKEKTEKSAFLNHENRPQIALIFDDLGENLRDLKNIYSLKIPITVSVIPQLQFSKNIAHIAHRCDFSVLIHLPLAPKAEENYQTDKYQFIDGSLTKREIDALLRDYLNAIRIAIGVNNHMGSLATEDPFVMEMVLRAIRRRGLIFVDSRTSLKSVAYDLAKKCGLICGYNEGFLDSIDEVSAIENKLEEFASEAKKKKKIIIIAHPRKNTIEVLKRRLPSLKKEIKFVTIEDYFGR